MGGALDDLKMYARLPSALRKILGRPMNAEQAKTLVRERMERRTDLFLASVERNIYGNPSSPYLLLLKLAGCEFGDFRSCVQQRGIEETLTMLRSDGVYLTFEEFKGRTPVHRSGLSFQITPTALNNPHMDGFMSIESGGSTGPPRASAVDVHHLLSTTPLQWLRTEAYDLVGAPEAIWQGILPASTLTTLMHRARMGQMPTRWFSSIGLRDSKHWIKYGLATYYTLSWMRLLGARAPFPEYVLPAQAHIVAEHVRALLSQHGKCRINTSVSRALRVSLVAQERGWDFGGTSFISGGEPCTSAKVSAIEKCGARFYSTYNLAEAGILACGCPHRSAPDDVHLVKDTYALICHPHPVEGFDVTVPAFQLTTLLPTAKQILLNLQIDDYGIIEERACGCLFDEYGFTTHLSEIRSYRKLTGEGVTLIGGDMLHILEHVLPSRFGGSALDYQMIEEEDERGFTQLQLVIHPRVDIADEGAVLEIVNKTLSETSAMADIARAGWKNSGSLKIKRMEPILTARGKLLPLHLHKSIPQKANHSKRV